MAGEIGSLEPGKRADLVVHDTTGLAWTPRGDTALQLVWSADGRSVRDVIVDGRVVVRDKQCVTVDVTTARAEAAEAAAALFRRAGITVPHRWPHIAAADLDR